MSDHPAEPRAAKIESWGNRIATVGVLVLILVVCFAAITTIGTNHSQTFSKVGSCIAGSGGGGGWSWGGSVAVRDRGREEGRAPAPAPPPKVEERKDPEGPKISDAVPRRDSDNGRQSGRLTAGSFDDGQNPLPLQAFVRKLGQRADLSDLPRRLVGPTVVVRVTDRAGAPVGNALVRIATSSREEPLTLTTRSDGIVRLHNTWDRLDTTEPLTVTVTPPDGGRLVSGKFSADATRVNVVLPTVQAALPRQLDLALVLDTTGSMGDELEYIKTEIRGIAESIRARFPEVKQRYSLILYRDDGDDYVTRVFPFTESLAEFRASIAAQTAAGGGDYPEAMHRGLEDANALDWRTSGTARVLFLIGDAPPHAQHLKRTMNAVDGLRGKGVAIYPVACSGYDDACELVMRGSALLTGGQFLFLTDDSGVGNAHAEPHIPYYQVQRLDRLMIRMIASELTGKRLPAEAGEVLRTVGRPPVAQANGVGSNK
jgi:hypothetical protein